LGHKYLIENYLAEGCKKIEVHDLTKKFNGKTILNGLNSSVQEGEIFGYLGPNGAGKTTTMRIILGLLRPTSEKALVFGDDLSISILPYQWKIVISG